MNQTTKRSSLPLLILFISALALLIRAKYSFCWSDETFYASTTNRFLQGDFIFVHEWFPTQLVSLLILPVQGLYKLITGSNDGLILFLRCVYVLFSFLTSLIIYHLICKDYQNFTALCCAMFSLFYAHLNIATLSYYTLSVAFFLLSMLLICDFLRDQEHTKKSRLVFSGICFAAAVLSLPSLAVAYFGCCVILILLSVKQKALRPIFPYTLIGILILAIPVLLYVLPTTGINGLIHNLTYVLSDEEHITSLVYPFKKFFLSVTDVYGRIPVALSVLFSFMALFLSIPSLKEKLPRIRTLLFYFNTILFLVYFVKSLGHTGYISTAICLFSLPLFFLTQKKNWHLFFLVFGGGLVFSMVYSYSSNGDLYIMALGHSIAAIAALCFLYDYRKEQPLQTTICLMITGIVLIQTMTLRFVNVYRDAPLSELTECITEGPAKGLYTTKKHLESYNGILSDIQNYCNTDGTVFITKLLPWGYLATEMPCGAPTTWRTTFDSKRLPLYYDEQTNRLPSVIYVLNEDAGSYETCGDVVADPTPNANHLGGFLDSYTATNHFQTIKTPYGTIYQRTPVNEAPQK